MIKIDDYKEFTTLLERVIHKYNQLENKQRTYGTETVLSRAEIHTIAAVGDNPGANITTLAGILGITKGSASQMIYKLVDKGTIEKKVSPDSDAEVVLSLTPDGQKNYAAHNDFHSQTNDEAVKLLKEVSPSFLETMIEFFSDLERIFDNRLERK